MNHSQRVRRSFQFDFGSIALPSCSSSSSSQSQSAKYSRPPPNMTCNDHQALGEYGTEDNRKIKITYNHVNIDGDSNEYVLCNPFVMRVLDKIWLIRDIPDGLIQISTTSGMQRFSKKSFVCEDKSNFAFNSIYNIFIDCECVHEDEILKFEQSMMEKSVDHQVRLKTVCTVMNPLSCMTQVSPNHSLWFVVDVSAMSIHELSVDLSTAQVDVKTYRIVRLPENVRILLSASKYFTTH